MNITRSMTKWLNLSLLAALSFASASAATVSFNYNGNGGDGTLGNTRNFTSSPTGVSVAVTAWTFNTGNNSFFQSAVGRYWGGLGVKNSSGDHHAVDNQGYFDFLLFSFSQAIDLNSVSLGWVSGNSDFKYWIGNTGTVSSLISAPGFNVDGGSSPATYSVNALNTFGSHVLIGAATGGVRDDKFKISGMNVSTREVKVPDSGATAALLGLGLMGVAGLRQRMRR